MGSLRQLSRYLVIAILVLLPLLAGTVICVFLQGCSSTSSSASGAITLVSTDSAGVQANDANRISYIASHGRYVVFGSKAENLVPGDNNHKVDAFVKDTLTGVTTLISTSSKGDQADGESVPYSISADGRFVAFSSVAQNLVPGVNKCVGCNNIANESYVKDTITGKTTCISSDSSGTAAPVGTNSVAPSISADGRYVAFESDAVSLVNPNTSKGKNHIFLKDTVTGATTLISSNSSGNEANGDSTLPSISSDGRYVAFDSPATNLGCGLTSTLHINMKDTLTGATTCVSTDTAGNIISGQYPSISADGRYVAFESESASTGGHLEIFVKDTAKGTSQLISRDSQGNAANDVSAQASISADGRYVAFESKASNLGGNANGRFQIYVADTVTGSITLVSKDAQGSPGNDDSSMPSISSDGLRLSFASSANNLVSGDINNVVDDFLADTQSVSDCVSGQTTSNQKSN